MTRRIGHVMSLVWGGREMSKLPECFNLFSSTSNVIWDLRKSSRVKHEETKTLHEFFMCNNPGERSLECFKFEFEAHRTAAWRAWTGPYGASKTDRKLSPGLVNAD